MASELHTDLESLANKYHFRKVVMIVEQHDPEKHTDTGTRTLIFIPKKEQQEFSLCKFAKMIEKALATSKTFREIMDHLNNHTIQEFIGDTLFPKQAKRAD